MMRNLSNETASQVVRGEELERRKVFSHVKSWTPRCLPQVRGVIATKGFHTFYDAEVRSVSDERFLHTSNSWTPRCLPQVRSVIATKGFHTFYDAEASALAAVSGGRR